MSRRETTEKIIDAVLRELVTSAAIGAGLVLPNLLMTLDKPLSRYLNHLDKKARQREARRIVYYMKAQGLIAGEYEFGIGITKKGRQTLERDGVDNIEISMPNRWDKLWRIVFYDIPEKHKSGRDALTAKLRKLGFYQLQRSVWIHPLPCRDVIEKITVTYQIEQYVSYIETTKLDNQKVLVKRFKKTYPKIHF